MSCPKIELGTCLTNYECLIAFITIDIVKKSFDLGRYHNISAILLYPIVRHIHHYDSKFASLAVVRAHALIKQLCLLRELLAYDDARRREIRSMGLEVH
jgi:hypothetical protein